MGEKDGLRQEVRLKSKSGIIAYNLRNYCPVFFNTVALHCAVCFSC